MTSPLDRWRSWTAADFTSRMHPLPVGGCPVLFVRPTRPGSPWALYVPRRWWDALSTVMFALSRVNDVDRRALRVVARLGLDPETIVRLNLTDGGRPLRAAVRAAEGR